MRVIVGWQIRGKRDGWMDGYTRTEGAPGCVVEKQTRRVSFLLKGGFELFEGTWHRERDLSARQTLCCWSTRVQ